MAREPYRELTDEQVQHFLERGHVVVEQALSRELAEQWRAFAFERLRSGKRGRRGCWRRKSADSASPSPP